jgi:hypothetical protein
MVKMSVIYFNLSMARYGTLSLLVIQLEIVFESHGMGSRLKKGDDPKSRRTKEKEQKAYENDDGEESLSLRSDRCAMGSVGTADPSPFPARSQAVCFAARGRECGLVRAQEWVPLASAAL